MSVYNPSRYNDQLLGQFSQSPPSFTVHFHQDHWLINQSRPHLYHTPISFLLDDIRERRIPTDWLASLDQNGITFYDGCLVIDLHDHRATGSGEDGVVKERVIIQPNTETIWADICLENERNGTIMTDKEAMEVEARMLAATSPPLCLDPDPLVTRIANSALRDSSLLPPAAFKRKQDAAETERHDAAKARQSKIMSLMNPHINRPMRAPSRLYDFIQRRQPPASQANLFQSKVDPQPQQIPTPVSATNTPPLTTPSSIQLTAASADGTRKTIKIRKRAEPQDATVNLEPMEPESVPQQSQPLQQQTQTQLQPGKAKRKASTSTPALGPVSKKKPGGKESAEPSPAPTHTQLPKVATPSPMPTAYPLPPSTALPFAKKTVPKKTASGNLVSVKTEPTHQVQPSPHAHSAGTPTPMNPVVPLPQVGMMMNNMPTQQGQGAPAAANNSLKGKPPTPAPAMVQQPAPQASGSFFPKQELSQFQYMGQQRPHFQQPSQQVQSTPSSSPHPPPGMLPQFQPYPQQQSQTNAIGQSPSRQPASLNRNMGNQGALAQAHPHMTAPAQRQSPFQQNVPVPSPQPQSMGTPQPAPQPARSPHPQHIQAPSRPASASQQPHMQTANHAAYLQAQQAFAMQQLQAQQQQQQFLPNPNFQLHLPGNAGAAAAAAAGWRLPQQQQQQHQQQLQLQLRQIQQQQLLGQALSPQQIHLLRQMGAQVNMMQFAQNGLGNLPPAGRGQGPGPQGQAK